MNLYACRHTSLDGLHKAYSNSANIFLLYRRIKIAILDLFGKLTLSQNSVSPSTDIKFSIDNRQQKQIETIQEENQINLKHHQPTGQIQSSKNRNNCECKERKIIRMKQDSYLRQVIKRLEEICSSKFKRLNSNLIKQKSQIRRIIITLYIDIVYSLQIIKRRVIMEEGIKKMNQFDLLHQVGILQKLVSDQVNIIKTQKGSKNQGQQLNTHLQTLDRSFIPTCPSPLSMMSHLHNHKVNPNNPTPLKNVNPQHKKQDLCMRVTNQDVSTHQSKYLKQCENTDIYLVQLKLSQQGSVGQNYLQSSVGKKIPNLSQTQKNGNSKERRGSFHRPIQKKSKSFQASPYKESKTISRIVSKRKQEYLFEKYNTKQVVLNGQQIQDSQQNILLDSINQLKSQSQTLSKQIVKSHIENGSQFGKSHNKINSSSFPQKYSPNLKKSKERVSKKPKLRKAYRKKIKIEPTILKTKAKIPFTTQNNTSIVDAKCQRVSLDCEQLGISKQQAVGCNNIKQHQNQIIGRLQNTKNNSPILRKQQESSNGILLMKKNEQRLRQAEEYRRHGRDYSLKRNTAIIFPQGQIVCEHSQQPLSQKTQATAESMYMQLLQIKNSLIQHANLQNYPSTLFRQQQDIKILESKQIHYRRHSLQFQEDKNKNFISLHSSESSDKVAPITHYERYFSFLADEEWIRRRKLSRKEDLQQKDLK